MPGLWAGKIIKNHTGLSDIKYQNLTGRRRVTFY